MRNVVYRQASGIEEFASGNKGIVVDFESRNPAVDTIAQRQPGRVGPGRYVVSCDSTGGVELAACDQKVPECFDGVDRTVARFDQALPFQEAT